jgi:putative transcriptional regulator
MAEYRPDPEKPQKLTAEQAAYHATLTDEERDAVARADVDNPPLTDAEAARVVAVRLIKRTRERLGLSQPAFANRYRINLSRLRDLEQGRYTPDSAVLAYLRVIDREPDLVARVLTDDAA